jgi:hypothetical protein
MSILEDFDKNYTFPKGYGQFPYILLKSYYAMFMQIPIHLLEGSEFLDFNEYPGAQLLNVSESILKLEKHEQIKVLHDRLFEHTQWIYNKIEKDSGKPPLLWLVEDKNTAYCFENGKVKKSSQIPREGTLLNLLNQPIKMSGKHYNKNN